MSEEYKEVPLKLIGPEMSLPANFYLLINEKFIHYLNIGDQIGIPKYDLFLNKNVKNLYVLDGDYDEVMEWCLTVRHTFREEAIEQVGEETREIIISALKIEDELYDVFSELTLTAERVEKIQKYSADFLENVKDLDNFKKALKPLLDRNETLAAHSSNVASLAVLIAMISGIGSKFSLENLYLAALFHDYGKVKIPPHIIENPSDANYEKLMLAHPEGSFKIIGKSEGVPEQVFKMVLEHHEYWDGSGYPKGKKGSELYEYSGILSMANEIDNFLIKNRTQPDIKRWKKAIKMLHNGSGTKWDPEYFPRVTDALKLNFLPNS